MKLKIDYIKFLMNGKTQKEVANLMGITSQYLSTILNRAWANMNIVNKLAEVLGVEPIEIIKLED